MTTLTRSTERAGRQCQVGSLTGAVASQRVTEAPKDTLSLDGNQAQSAKAKGCARCRKVKGSGDELRTEAPVNGGRNYNGPKVAKFLVG